MSNPRRDAQKALFQTIKGRLHLLPKEHLEYSAKRSAPQFSVFHLNHEALARAKYLNLPPSAADYSGQIIMCRGHGCTFTCCDMRDMDRHRGAVVREPIDHYRNPSAQGALKGSARAAELPRCHSAQPASPAARAGAGGAWPGAAELTRISASPVPDDTLSSVTVMHESISAALDDCVRVSDWETRASDHTFVATLKASNGKAVPQMVKIALDDDSLKRIGAEWLILNSLRQQPRSEGHFNVVSSGHMYIVASGKYRGRVAMLLHPHCEAGSLLGRDAGEEVDSFKELLLLLIGWAKGLAYLHANDILHGDVRVDHLLQHSMLVAPAFKVYESVGLICSLGSAKQLVYHRCRLEGTRPLQYVADENWGNHTMRWRQQRGLPQAGSLHYPDDTVDVRYDIFALAVAAAEAAMGERFDCAEPSDATLSDMAACRPGLEDFRDMLEVRQCRGARDVRTRILKRFQGKASPATIQEFCIVLQRCMSSDPEERMTLADVVDACDALAKNSI